MHIRDWAIERIVGPVMDAWQCLTKIGSHYDVLLDDLQTIQTDRDKLQRNLDDCVTESERAIIRNAAHWQAKVAELEAKLADSKRESDRLNGMVKALTEESSQLRHGRDYWKAQAKRKEEVNV